MPNQPHSLPEEAVELAVKRGRELHCYPTAAYARSLLEAAAPSIEAAAVERERERLKDVVAAELRTALSEGATDCIAALNRLRAVLSPDTPEKQIGDLLSEQANALALDSDTPDGGKDGRQAPLPRPEKRTPTMTPDTAQIPERVERWTVDYEHAEGEPQHAVLSWLSTEPTRGLPEVGEVLVRGSDLAIERQKRIEALEERDAALARANDARINGEQARTTILKELREGLLGKECRAAALTAFNECPSIGFQRSFDAALQAALDKAIQEAERG